MGGGQEGTLPHLQRSDEPCLRSPGLPLRLVLLETHVFLSFPQPCLWLPQSPCQPSLTTHPPLPVPEYLSHLGHRSQGRQTSLCPATETCHPLPCLHCFPRPSPAFPVLSQSSQTIPSPPLWPPVIFSELNISRRVLSSWSVEFLTSLWLSLPGCDALGELVIWDYFLPAVPGGILA